MNVKQRAKDQLCDREGVRLASRYSSPSPFFRRSADLFITMLILLALSTKLPKGHKV